MPLGSLLYVPLSAGRDRRDLELLASRMAGGIFLWKKIVFPMEPAVPIGGTMRRVGALGKASFLFLFNLDRMR